MVLRSLSQLCAQKVLSQRPSAQGHTQGSAAGPGQVQISGFPEFTFTHLCVFAHSILSTGMPFFSSPALLTFLNTQS